MIRKASAAAVLVVLLASTGLAQDQISQLVAQLQKSPNDNVLREKIIKLAATAKPALPEEAERRMARGAAAFKGAKSVADYQDAIREYRLAVEAAPWYGDAYFNLGVAEDKAEKYADALESLKWAQMASPDAKDIKALVYEVEFRNEKYSSPEAKAERARSEQVHNTDSIFAFLQKRFKGPAIKLLRCGANHGSISSNTNYLHCTLAEAAGSSWSDFIDRTDAYIRPNPVKIELADRDKGVIKVTLGDAGEFCGSVVGSDIRSVVWDWCGRAGSIRLNEYVVLLFSNAGEPTGFESVMDCQNGTDNCRRQRIYFY